jgi:hypothetical protein
VSESGDNVSDQEDIEGPQRQVQEQEQEGGRRGESRGMQEGSRRRWR